MVKSFINFGVVIVGATVADSFRLSVIATFAAFRARIPTVLHADMMSTLRSL
jgi:hypothetical protein